MIKPKVLRPGARVGVLAPASAPKDHTEVERGLRFLEELGFSVHSGRSVTEKWGYLAGSDELRADDINRMFADPEIEAIFCLRGGWGSSRLLSRLDFHTIQAHPKLFVGYSDITSLHLAFNQRVGLVTIHGPMAFEYPKSDDSTVMMLRRALFDTEPTGTYFPLGESYTICPGRARGRLVGGNLSLIAASLGTPFAIDTKDRILFLEDVDEEPYRIDRMLTQLKLAGKLQEAAGIVVGTCVNCDPKAEQKSFTLREVLVDHLGSLGIPSYYGLPVGHGRPNFALPLGVTAVLDAEYCQLEVVEAATVKD